MKNDLTHQNFQRRAKRLYVVLACLTLVLTTGAVPALAANNVTNDALAAVSNLSNFIFSLIRAVGLILLGYGILQVGLLTVYSRFFKLFMATAIAPIPLSSFAGQPSSSIGVAFLKAYASICLEGCVIVLACVIFSGFASTPPAITDSSLAPATIVWNYIGELVFHMLVLVGCIKMSDRLMHELMGI